MRSSDDVIASMGSFALHTPSFRSHRIKMPVQGNSHIKIAYYVVKHGSVLWISWFGKLYEHSGVKQYRPNKLLMRNSCDVMACSDHIFVAHYPLPSSDGRHDRDVSSQNSRSHDFRKFAGSVLSYRQKELHL